MNILIVGNGKMGQLLKKRLGNNHQIIQVDAQNQNWFKNMRRCDLLIDFSSASSIVNISKYCQRFQNLKIIIGTTSHSQEQINLINNLSLNHRVIYESNFSIGKYIFLKIIDLINAYPLNEYRFVIEETHHKSKIDIPSGTSIDLLKRLRFQGKIISYREDDITGIHRLIFDNQKEKIMISHQVETRDVFIDGVLSLIPKLDDLANGLYDMEKILDGKK
jgi:4-hydroxy-tetrahydrodipicolinate reductase